MTHHGPDSGDATTILPIVYSVTLRGTRIRMSHFPGTPEMESRNCPECVPVGLPWLWTAITPRPNLGSGRGLNQSYSPRRDLSNDISHPPSARQERVDSWLLVVRSRTASLTPGPSFAHNLGCKCPNDQCEAILTSTLQDLSNDTKNARMQGDLTPSIALWIFESPGGLQLPTFGSVGFTLTLSPKWGCDNGFGTYVRKNINNAFNSNWTNELSPSVITINLAKV
jgi:hypothetical protein